MIALAIRYLLARRRQTILTLGGIFFGTVAFVCISGFMLGFREYIIDQLVNNGAHVHIQVREEFLTEHGLDEAYFGKTYRHVFWNVPPSGRKDSAMVDNPQNWYHRLKADPRVEAYSPQLTASVIFSKGFATASAALVGCDPTQQANVTTIENYMTEGNFSDLGTGGNRLVVGGELAKSLGIILYQNVTVSSARGMPTPFKVIGIYKTGTKQADNMAYGSIADVQKVNRTPNKVNEIAVKLYDYTQAAALAKIWSQISTEKVESWDQQNAAIFNVTKIQNAVRFLSIGAVLIVAGFGIYNVLNMTVIQKRKDIAILRSMGYGTGDIVALFFSQGLIVGVFGAVFGLFVGYGICLYLQTIPFGGSPLGAGSGHLMISFSRQIYIQGFILAVLASVIASVLPARSAGSMSPIEIIRTGAD